MRVYDNSPATDSTSAAYQHSQLIHIMELPSHYPSSIISSTINGFSLESSTSFLMHSSSFLFSNSVTPSVVLKTTTGHSANNSPCHYFSTLCCYSLCNSSPAESLFVHIMIQYSQLSPSYIKLI